ncbi:MAG: ATP-dependent DNA helicase RecG [Deltaproteobacteria bacterium]|nr:ATP-dependent DNA helicase RecG [Deltaproteobacteria bacterium]
MPDKAAQTLSNILSSLLKPLVFASKDDFAHLSTIKGLEGLVAALCMESACTDLPPEISRQIKELERIFKGFDGFVLDEKKGRIKRALEIVADIKEGVHFSPSPQMVEGVSDKGECGSAPLRPGAARNGAGLSAQSLSDALKDLKKLSTPLQYVKGIGPKFAARLEKKGLGTVEDVLYFLPIRYEDRRHIKRIKELTPGVSEVSTGEIMAVGETRYGRRKVFEAAVSDGSSVMGLKWFNYRLPYMKKKYRPGDRIIFYGPVSAFGHKKEIIHPDVEFVEPEAEAGARSEGIVPVYSQIENLHQKTLRRIVRGIVGAYAPYAIGCAPAGVMARRGFIGLKEAFIQAHMPEAMDDIPRIARKSLAFDELFSLELGLALKRRGIKKESGVAMEGGGVLEKKLLSLLPFELTRSQKRVIEEIRKDMASAHPMNRLIQGDVGSGKTVVSFIAMLVAIESGYQAAVMAPTEILAEQHFLTTRDYAERLGIKTALLTGATPAAERRKTLAAVKEGAVNLVIGTHALIQKDVEFKDLGLAVIDEQHRFGVVERAGLKKKGANGDISPDVLVMTATPIPRTLSMTVFGDLDVSIIDELPVGRKPVVTRLMREKDRAEAYRVIRDELKNGHQAYIVYPLVEESTELSLRDATRMKGHLEKDVFGEFNVGLMHGRMKGAEKESVMKAFRDKKLDILVSTTVIEVGVDVPNATVILIEHAERLGLAQLHQLRGRVGRGGARSVCILLAQYTPSTDTWQRLKVLEGTMDGFRIAEEDLRIRGPGDFIGTRQSGMPEFRAAEALSDLDLLKKAREEALAFLERYPELTAVNARIIKEILKSRWQDRLELAEIG